MCAVFSAGERGRTGEVSRIVEAGRGTEEKTPRPVHWGVCVSLLIWWSRGVLIVIRLVDSLRRGRLSRDVAIDYDFNGLDYENARMCYLLPLCI